MIDLITYTNTFSCHGIPCVLQDLLTFELSLPDQEDYIEGFRLAICTQADLNYFCKSERFRTQLFPFAQADQTGSLYALWLQDNTCLAEAPVVVLGSDKHYYVVANNLLDFLRLLAIDTEPIIDEDGVYYHRDEDNYERSRHLGRYKKWLKSYYQLHAISNNHAAQRLVDQAQKAYQEIFENWLNMFILPAYSYN